MSQNLTCTKIQPRVGGPGLTFHRTIEILLAHRRGAAIRDIDPALDREQVKALADLAAYYFGEAERMRPQSADIRSCSRQSSRSAIIEEFVGVGC